MDNGECDALDVRNLRYVGARKRRFGEAAKVVAMVRV
jgi:hypothetical protein